MHVSFLHSKHGRTAPCFFQQHTVKLFCFVIGKSQVCILLEYDHFGSSGHIVSCFIHFCKRRERKYLIFIKQHDLITVRKLHNKIVALHQLCCGDNLLIDSVFLAVTNIGFDDILKHHRDLTHQLFQINGRFVNAAKVQHSVLRIVKPGNQPKHCTLSAAGRSHNGG